MCECERVINLTWTSHGVRAAVDLTLPLSLPLISPRLPSLYLLLFCSSPSVLFLDRGLTVGVPGQERGYRALIFLEDNSCIASWRAVSAAEPLRTGILLLCGAALLRFNLSFAD